VVSPSSPSISIIIPFLNESENLHQCLASIPKADGITVIASDGGSSDDSIEIATHYGATIVRASNGRATQMNAGAEIATGDVLLFLHADTRLPANAIESIQQAITNDYAVGCFERVFDSDSPLLKRTSHWAGWRARKFFFAFGDQAIFIRRDLFEHLGGYRNLRRFEDLDLSLRARKRDRWSVLSGPVTTSARRFGKSPLRRLIKDACITIAWLLGIISS
jgi:rSAM/selenodomain-associated transferase 2